jgi:hypothetical protein
VAEGKTGRDGWQAAGKKLTKQRRNGQSYFTDAQC